MKNDLFCAAGMCVFHVSVLGHFHDGVGSELSQRRLKARTKHLSQGCI
jgi:hypothetical protein